MMVDLLENMTGIIEVALCKEPHLLAVYRGEDTCYVKADEWAENGKVALTGSEGLRNDIKRCLYGLEKYLVSS